MCLYNVIQWLKMAGFSSRKTLEFTFTNTEEDGDKTAEVILWDVRNCWDTLKNHSPFMARVTFFKFLYDL